MKNTNGKTKIYLTCFPINNGVLTGDVMGQAVREDGVPLTSHLSSDVTWAKHDLGLTGNWKHEIYQEKCPEGYELIWIDDPHTDPRWQDVLAKNKALEAAAKGVKQ